ncbi:MAG: polymorphic toxin-type HINT domain-containing protein [Chloroflexota bacterium]
MLAYDEATGKTGYFAVTALISNLDFTVQDLTIDGEQIETTAGHPFYTQERGWVKAADLKVGEHVRKADGSYGVVKTDHAQMQVQRMYNLTVDKAHTFFVGGQQWLVHNSNAECDFWLPDDAEVPLIRARNLPPDTNVEWGAIAQYDPKTGELEQISLYNGDGNAIYHIDAPDVETPYWHLHDFRDTPGVPSYGHGADTPHPKIADLQQFLRDMNFPEIPMNIGARK